MTDQPDPALRALATAAYARAAGEIELPTEAPNADELACLERALLTLPRRAREIFLAHRIDGYSYAKIADITGLSRKQVMRHMTKAFVRLTRYMDGDERSPWQRWWQSQVRRWFG